MKITGTKDSITGIMDGTLRPNDNITYAEAVTAMNYGSKRNANKIDKQVIAVSFLDVAFSHCAYVDMLEASVVGSSKSIR